MPERHEVTPKSLYNFLYDSIEGESLIAFNPAVKDDTCPDELVMLFEAEPEIDESTRDYPLLKRDFAINDADGNYSKYKNVLVHKNRWNINGGPEKLRLIPSNDFVTVTFADSCSYMVPINRLKTLQWDLKNTDYSGIIQRKIALMNLYMGDQKLWRLGYTAIFLAVPTFIILAIFRFKKCKFRYILFSAIMSTSIGYLMGMVSEEGFFVDHAIGRYLGAISGFVSGICFAVIAARFVKSKWRIAVIYPLSVLLILFCTFILYKNMLIINHGFRLFYIYRGLTVGIWLSYFSTGIFLKIISKRYSTIQLCKETNLQEPA